MSCVHLQKLVQLCDENQLRFSSSDMVQVVCDQCQRHEVCPNLSVEHYEVKHSQTKGEGSAAGTLHPKETATSEN